MSQIDQSLLEEYSDKVEQLSDEYQDFIQEKFNRHIAGTSPVFYSILDNATRKYQNEVVQESVDGFKKICIAAGLVVSLALLKRFRKSISFFVKSAFSQYKNTVSLQFSKFREGASEPFLREKFLKELLKARLSAEKRILGKDDTVISVGKRSYHLSNYIRMTMETEASSNFVLQTVLSAKKDGAIGIRISDHNTVCNLCDEFEGKTYLFDNGDFAKLTMGLPPFHPNCKHFVIPVYANN